MKKTYIVSVAILFCVAFGIALASMEVKKEADNVVSSRLEGKWKLEKELTQRLTGKNKNVNGVLAFKADPSVTQKIPKKYQEFFSDNAVYMAGSLTLGDKKYPFVLTVMKGNPHVIFFRERDGDPMGDAESFNVMLAVGKDKKSDLLFIGGDFNNQPFSAYERAE